MRYVKHIEANTKNRIDIDLSARTIIVGPNGSGKTAIVNAIELALSGKASDIQGRSLVADVNTLLTLADHKDSEKRTLCATAILDNGEVADWQVKGKKGTWTKTPAVFDPEATFPLRTVREALAGSVETVRKFFLRFIGHTVTIEDVLGQIPTPLQARLKTVLPQDTTDVSATILQALETTKRRLTEARAEAKAAAIVVANANSINAPPSAKVLEEAKAALAKAREDVAKYEKELATIEAQAHFAKKRDEQRAEAERLQELMESLNGDLTDAKAELARTAQKPTPADKVRENLLAVLGFLTEKPSKACPCCGGEVNVEDFPYGQRLVEMRKKHEERQKVFARATELEARIHNVTHELDVARADLARISEDGLLEDTTEVSDVGYTELEDALGAARADAQAAEQTVMNLERARGAWDQVKRARDEVAMREEEAAGWERLADALKETIGTLLGQAKNAFETAVQRHLPDEYHFALVLNEEDREVCRYGFLRDGAIDTAACGGEWAMLLGALTAAVIDADEGPDDQPRVMVLPDTGWDSSKLMDVMFAFKDAPCQVIIATTTRPERIPDGWRCIDLYDDVAQLSDVDGGPRVEGELSGTNCAVCDEPQRETPSGRICVNGHGGADSVPVPAASSKGAKKSAKPKIPAKATRKKKAQPEGGDDL